MARGVIAWYVWSRRTGMCLDLRLIYREAGEILLVSCSKSRSSTEPCAYMCNISVKPCRGVFLTYYAFQCCLTSQHKGICRRTLRSFAAGKTCAVLSTCGKYETISQPHIVGPGRTEGIGSGQHATARAEGFEAPIQQFQLPYRRLSNLLYPANDLHLISNDLVDLGL